MPTKKQSAEDVLAMRALLPISTNWETDQERKVLNDIRDVYARLLNKAARKRTGSIASNAMLCADYQTNINAVDRILSKHYS